MRLSIILIGLSFLFSCSMAKLTTYPGERQDTVCAELQGDYYYKLSLSSNDPKDSMFIHVGRNGWVQYENQKPIEYVLSDKVVLSRVGKYYVISHKDDEQPAYWNAWVLVPKKKNVSLFPIISVNAPHTDPLSKFLKKEQMSNGKDSFSYYTTTDAEFVRYFEKELKGNKTIQLIRILKK